MPLVIKYICQVPHTLVSPSVSFMTSKGIQSLSPLLHF